MSSLDRNRADLDLDTVVLILVITAVALYGLVHLGYTLDGADTDGLLFTILAGDAVWPAAATRLLLTAAGTAVVGALAYLWLFGFPAKEDPAAKHLASPFAMRRLTKHGALRAHKRFSRPTPGVMLGRMVRNAYRLYATLELTMTVIVGPRMNKTTGLAIPLIMEAGGAVVVTSNKRDIVDATRDPRATLGRVWVFDPQGIIGEPADFYWDPITYVIGGPDDDPGLMDARAAQLTHRFAFATGTHHTGNPDYFDRSGEALMGQFVLAAACAGRNILAVREWVVDQHDAEPAQLLEEHGYHYAAAKLRATMALTAKQKDGIYDTASTMTSFLTMASVQRWVTPGEHRVPFDPHAFAASTDTLYSVSREGVASMGPLVTALTVAVCEAAESAADRSGGRLPTEMRLVLDEVANVCKWDDLPEQYSHYGSKGILVASFLQSWSQAADVWGESGIAKLWSASGIRIVGGGLSEPTFLRATVDAIGSYYRGTRSTSRGGRSGASHSNSEHKDDILDVSDLTAMSGRRFVMFVSGHRPVLLRVVPSWKRRYAPAVRASKKNHEPAATPAPVTPARGRLTRVGGPSR